jgi:hypothetical protein
MNATRRERDRAFGRLQRAQRHAARLRTQMQVIRDVMLSASECDTWLTLYEIAALTRYGEASISAQLRHLRKPRFGGHRVEKRRRDSASLTTGEDASREASPSAELRASARVWEYCMRRPLAAPEPPAKQEGGPYAAQE